MLPRCVRAERQGNHAVMSSAPFLLHPAQHQLLAEGHQVQAAAITHPAALKKQADGSLSATPLSPPTAGPIKTCCNTKFRPLTVDDSAKKTCKLSENSSDTHRFLLFVCHVHANIQIKEQEKTVLPVSNCCLKPSSREAPTSCCVSVVETLFMQRLAAISQTFLSQPDMVCVLDETLASLAFPHVDIMCGSS